MNILVINESAGFGGAEIQTMLECKLLQQYENNVMLMTLDPNVQHGWVNNSHYNIQNKQDKHRKFHMMITDVSVEKKIKKQVDDFNPDYVHVNNVSTYALPVYKAIKGYKCIRTIHDYGTVCPNSWSIHEDLTMCDGYNGVCKCTVKCFFKKNGFKNKGRCLWEWMCFKRRNYMQKRSIKNFVCPSQMLTHYCNEFGMKTTCINNPIDFSALNTDTNKHWAEKKIFLYYGLIVDFKGVTQLVEAFAEFSKNKDDVELHFVGDIQEGYKSTFEQLMKKYVACKIFYLGKLDYKSMMSKLQSIHTVVVPSVWIENYPNTALEAVASGCFVLGSDRGGTREIIGDDRFVFNVLDKNDFVDKLNVAYELTDKEYKRITDINRRRIEENNSFDKYYSRLMDCLSSIQ